MSSQDPLERSFTPSQWSRRLPASRVVGEYVRVTTEESLRVRREVPAELGLKYGNKKSNGVDVFGGGAVPDDAPILVFFSGGYWQVTITCCPNNCLLMLGF